MSAITEPSTWQVTAIQPEGLEDTARQPPPAVPIAYSTAQHSPTGPWAWGGHVAMLEVATAMGKWESQWEQGESDTVGGPYPPPRGGDMDATALLGVTMCSAPPRG